MSVQLKTLLLIAASLVAAIGGSSGWGPLSSGWGPL
jgi:hypothetical protein